METKEIKDITIKEYIDLLKDGSDVELLQSINEFLSSRLSGVSGGFDLQLFQLEKDRLVFICKLAIASNENVLAGNKSESPEMKRISKRINELTEAIEKKKAKGEKADPYTSLIQWLLTLKKYYGSDIDKSNDLIYLVEATNSMMKWYGSQNEEIEKQKAQVKTRK